MLKQVGLSVVLAGAVVWFSGCASPFSPELRREAKRDLTITDVMQTPDAYKGAVVIWGGKVLEVTNTREGSEMTILEIPLDYQDIPESERASRGRFIARTNGFLDPEVYAKNRRVTVAGDVLGLEARDVGQALYRYPLVGIREIHLWQRRVTYYYPYYYYPNFYYPYSSFWYDRWPYYGRNFWDEEYY